jgi:hypothetical protein
VVKNLAPSFDTEAPSGPSRFDLPPEAETLAGSGPQMVTGLVTSTPNEGPRANETRPFPRDLSRSDAVSVAAHPQGCVNFAGEASPCKREERCSTHRRSSKFRPTKHWRRCAGFVHRIAAFKLVAWAPIAVIAHSAEPRVGISDARGSKPHDSTMGD